MNPSPSLVKRKLSSKDAEREEEEEEKQPLLFCVSAPEGSSS